MIASPIGGTPSSRSPRVAVVGAVVSALDADAKRKDKVEADADAQIKHFIACAQATKFTDKDSNQTT